MRIKPTTDSDIIASLVYNDFNSSDDFFNQRPNPDFIFLSDEKGHQFESQYLWSGGIRTGLDSNLILGLGTIQIDVDRLTSVDFAPGPCLIPSGCEIPSNFDKEMHTIYGYTNLRIPSSVIWTFGLAYYDFEQGKDGKLDDVAPKIGFQWSITDNLSARATVFESLKAPYVVNQTIEPTNIASFPQVVDDRDGTQANNYGIGLDLALSRDIKIGLEYLFRDIDAPIFSEPNQEITNEEFQDILYRSYLYYIYDDRISLNTVRRV